MDVLAESLDLKLRTWKPEVAEQVRQRVAEIIELADHDGRNQSSAPPLKRL